MPKRLREEIVSINGDEAHAELWQYRREKAAVSVTPLKVDHGQLREAIQLRQSCRCSAPSKRSSKRAADFWPLSDRQIHYALLERSAADVTPASRVRSTETTRPATATACGHSDPRRLDWSSIPFEAIGDETRPVQVWDVHQTVRAFARRELDGMFKGYWRDLMQSQPNHIELIGEKNTVGSISAARRR